MNQNPYITVLIPVLNEEESLPELQESLAAPNFAHFVERPLVMREGTAAA